MRLRGWFGGLILLCALAAAQSTAGTTTRARKKSPGVEKPSCATGATCFAGEVSDERGYLHAINNDLDFVLEPGWTIGVRASHPAGDCGDFANVLNPPYRQHRALYINVTYGWTAEEETAYSPREFDFVTNCADYRTEADRLDIVLWPYTATQEKYDQALAKLGSSPAGKGRLWVTDSRITHAEDTEFQKGRIEWMKFTVEIRLPKRY
jgi:hypothetical protein